jgi:hypothetical protein
MFGTPLFLIVIRAWLLLLAFLLAWFWIDNYRIMAGYGHVTIGGFFILNVEACLISFLRHRSAQWITAFILVAFPLVVWIYLDTEFHWEGMISYLAFLLCQMAFPILFAVGLLWDDQVNAFYHHAKPADQAR